MRNKKPLLSAQRRFLQYIMVRRPPVIDRHTEDRIRRALKNDEYLTFGTHETDFNRLRSDYISDFYEFEQSTDPDSFPGGGWFDCEQSEF